MCAESHQEKSHGAATMATNMSNDPLGLTIPPLLLFRADKVIE
jgi:hypothetical protein